MLQRFLVYAAWPGCVRLFATQMTNSWLYRGRNAAYLHSGTLPNSIFRKGTTVTAGQPWYRILYVQVLIAIAIGVALGYFYPDAGKAMKPLGDGFISLIKMMIAPAIFCTVVHGISSIGDMRKV